ncbi:nucleoside-diphosphate kinase [Pyrobaculum aerophilum]|uniref:Nucleoside diphosphate kinase n=2 Tax=Pyrobaculum aerophilum TaxID=13773 RepID=NDK_PYRAE|nr:nucleoside-diphosphate kinase [Pyrobaculum aerophilum]Q8ZWY4.1 RecName: Full=Nucleoside diphosphate kinase; Short=NDK; Short=NDP kinase; AltName: Full=Nucleoside-2-P kinase [Pyrobaculum aerophilum str. IM2]HII46432.1 nucleoside-diphosphate kinase [Pyrobaculum aerophilum]
MPVEKTLLILKPDAVARGLVGEIISRFEKAGLKIVALKMVKASPEEIERFYPSSEEWLRSAGQKLLKAYQELGIDPRAKIGTDDPVEVGRIIKRSLVKYMTSGPIVVMVLKGNRAVEIVRKLVGPTSPHSAPPGTIRGDYSIDSPDLAAEEGRVVFNLVHASDSPSEAEREIRFWFREEEVLE